MTNSEALWDQKRNTQGAAVAAVEDSIYGRLFLSSMTARRLWRTTQIGRMVREVVESDSQTLAPDVAALQSEALFLIVHLVFSRLQRLCDGITLTLTAAERLAISNEIEQVRMKLSSVYGAEDWGDLEPPAVLGDQGNVKRLKGQVMAALAT